MLKIHDPAKLLTRDVWQIKIVILLEVDNYNFSLGSEADEMKFINPSELDGSEHEPESRVPEYYRLSLG